MSNSEAEYHTSRTNHQTPTQAEVSARGSGAMLLQATDQLADHMPSRTNEPLLNNNDSDDESVCDLMYEQVTTVMNGVTDALEKVVTELRCLKQQQVESHTSRTNQEEDVHTDDVIQQTSSRLDPPSGRRYDATCRAFSEQNTPIPRDNSNVNAPSASNCRTYRRYPDHVDGYNRSIGAGERQTHYIEHPHRGYRNERSNGMLPQNIKVPPFTGKDDWAVWLAKFEAISNRY